MFHLHHADALEPLLDALADVLAAPPEDPFTPDLVVVPAVGLRDAAMVGLGRRLGSSGLGDGIAANVEFVFPGRFLGRVLGQPSPADGPEADPWQLPRLAWTVLEELAAGQIEVPGAGLEQRWALARRVADLFDRYATQRPKLVLQWAEGIDGDGTVRDDGTPNLLPDTHRWQPALWRAVRARIGRPSLPERLPLLLLDLGAGRLQPLLPQRVAVFGVGSLTATTVLALQALAEAGREVHVFLRHPSAAAWHGSPHRLAMGVNPRAAVDVTVAVSNPLLSSWGRPSLEARALLRGLEHVVEVPHEPSVVPVGSLLGAVQHSVRLDQKPSVQPVDPFDGSVQVHACHGVVRQLEVLRDALGHAFIDDPTLQPHEVLVLCPDLERFAPMVEAVLGRGDLPVPVRVGDRSLSTDEPVLEALQRVLTLVSGRATLSEVLSLVQFEPVRRRFGWSVEQVEQFAGWCDELGARWGLTADHRVPWGLPSQIANGTWQAVVDRLLAGAAMAAPTPRLVLGEVAPYDDIGTGEFELVGTVADLLARLLELHQAVQGARPVAEWVALLHRVIDGFTAPDPLEPWRHQAVHRELADVLVAASPDGGQHGPSQVPLTLADLRSLLSDAVSSRTGRLPLRSGSVTVSSMVPQHGVPARVICLLGLDDGTLRGGTFDGDDVLGLRPCVGERHPRHESRQMLLDAVLAARERVIITCNGSDLTTNKPVPLVVPLQELLDVVQSLTGVPHGRLVLRHPRHGFGEPALRPGGLVAAWQHPFTFDRSMLAAATARRSVDLLPTASPVSPWLLAPMPMGQVSVDALVDALANPSKVYLQQRLDVSIPPEPATVEDGLAVELAPLGTANAGRELLAVRRRGGAAQEWEVVARLDGAMPPGELSSLALQEVREEVSLLEALAAAWRLPLEAGEEVRVHLALPVALDAPDGTAPVADVVVQGDVRGLVLSAGAGRLADIRFTRPRPSMRLALAVRLAALELVDPSRVWRATLLTRNPESARTEPVGRGFRLRGDTAAREAGARELLAMALQMLHWARRDAVPYFDKTSEKLHRGEISAVYNDLERNMFPDRFEEALWPELQADVLLDEPVLSHDPPFLDRGLSRASAVASFVWGTFDRVVEEVDVDDNPVDADGGDDE